MTQIEVTRRVGEIKDRLGCSLKEAAEIYLRLNVEPSYHHLKTILGVKD